MNIENQIIELIKQDTFISDDLFNLLIKCNNRLKMKYYNYLPVPLKKKLFNYVDEYLVLGFLGLDEKVALDYDFILNIFLSFKDDANKINAINYFPVNSIYRLNLLKSIKNPDVIIENYVYLSSIEIGVMFEFFDEYYAIEHLNILTFGEKINYLKGLKNIDIFKSFLENKVYTRFLVKFINKIDDKEYVINFFKSHDSSIKYEIIKSFYNDTEFQNELVNLLDSDFIKEIFKSNINNYKIILNKQRVINYDIDPSLTFGVELEMIHKDSESIIHINNVLNNWQIEEDGSLNGGLEVVSPVLRYEKEYLKELDYVLELFSKNGSYTDNSCGGHIHFGFNYFESVPEIYNFLNLYYIYEEILHLLCNRKGTTMRRDSGIYAGKSIYIPKLNETYKAEDFNSVEEYGILIKVAQEKRYYGLNMLNIFSKSKNTIEFRFPNGEINFNELNYNIRILSKLIIKSRENPNLINSLNEILWKYDDYMKVDILLNMLFDTEKERNIYYDRFNKNMELENKVLLEKKLKI